MTSPSATCSIPVPSPNKRPYFAAYVKLGDLARAGLALAGAEVELAVVPGADHVVAVEPPLAERAADVVADARRWR